MKIVKVTQNLSFVPFQIRLTTVDEKPLATGTAFLYEFEAKNYLVTNWHNVTGKNPHDFSCLSKSSVALPHRMKACVPFESDAGNGKRQFDWRETTLNLYEDDDNNFPKKSCWYVHPEYDHKVDVVVLECDTEGWAAIPANSGILKLNKLAVQVGMEAFVLGYPIGISGGGGFPLWKRASVASEPDFDMNQLPMFYIDTATKQGMSGSPVYFHQSGMWIEEGKSFPADAILGAGDRFAGIYSGRTDGEEFFAQIGKVWKEEVIRRIIEVKCLGKSSYDYCA